MKKILGVAVSALMAITCVETRNFNIYANSLIDNKIFSDQIKNIYTGTNQGLSLIKNLNFKDMVGNKDYEKVVRGGSLNIIKGYSSNFNPNQLVSNREALATIIRMIGLESDANLASSNLKNEEKSLNAMYKGYINIALEQNLINNDDYLKLISEENKEGLFGKSPVTREQFAVWLAMGLKIMGSNDINLEKENTDIFNFSDWQSIDSKFLTYIDKIVSNKIMLGDINGKFNPKGNITNIQLANIINNVDKIYFDLKDIKRKTGTVGGFKDSQEKSIHIGGVWRNFYIRNSNGDVDIIQYEYLKNPSSKEDISDCVVFKDGKIGGINTLSEGDKIEYLYSDKDKNVIYINVIQNEKSSVNTSFEGKLYSIDAHNGTIVLQGDNGKNYSYKLVSGIYGIDTEKDNNKNNNKNRDKDQDEFDENKYIYIDDKKQKGINIPIGSKVKLNLENDIVTSINFIGQETKVEEMQGIVIENNYKFGYIVFRDINGNKITKNYYSNDMKVQKQEYYQVNEDIGYISQMFPHFKYNPKETSISAIEPGDIVFMRFDPNDNNIVVNISASTSYTYKYGSIKQISRDKNNVMQVLIQYDNGQTIWFDIPNEVFISKNGSFIENNEIKVGDYIKLLINKATISAGYVLESVKEVVVENDAKHISDIIKGQVSGFNALQNEIIIQNAQSLTKTGWENYKNLKQLNIYNKDIEFYHNDKRVSLDYINKFLKRNSGEVYIAIDSSATGQKVRKLTFRTGRDELLNPDSVISADGTGSFMISSVNGKIGTDNGTIVRKNGRLVDPMNISISDYTRVALNGQNSAAVVDIDDIPSYSNVSIARGRISSVNPKTSFKVESIATLQGEEWVYTPVEREFSIDYNTLFINKDGYVSIDKFIDYTDESVKNKSFNIIYDGSKATHIIESPYSYKMVRGDIYEISDNSVKIKNAKYYNEETAKWVDVSIKDNTLNILLPNNSIIIKNNEVKPKNKLVNGDQIRIMTNSLTQKIASGSNIDGYIILVEK